MQASNNFKIQRDMPKVSVIVCVYNVEQWIERCSHSLFGQTLDDIEFVFVDDCSPDKSIDIMQKVLKKYPNRKSNVKIIRHKQNQGLASARITGLKNATGYYIIYCDPDDWVELNAYEQMYKLGIKNDTDIIICNLMIHTRTDLIYKNIKKYKTPQDCLAAYPLKNTFYHACWNKMIKRKLMIDFNIYPIESVRLGEDTNMMCRELHFAKSIAFCEDYLYHYNRMNDNSLTQSGDLRKNLDMAKINTQDMVSFLENANLKKYKETINYIKFFCKIKYHRCYPEDYNGFYNFYKECRKDILKFTNEPLKIRIYYFIIFHSRLAMKLFHK